MNRRTLFKLMAAAVAGVVASPWVAKSESKPRNAIFRWYRVRVDGNGTAFEGIRELKVKTRRNIEGAYFERWTVKGKF